MTNYAQVAQEALSLPLSERVQLAQQLWASVQPSAHADPQDEERQALDLADQRDAAMEGGLAGGISHADAVASARKSLECK